MTNLPAGARTTSIATFRATKRYLSCECGFSVAASDLGELVEAAKHHAARAHRMKLSGDQLASLAKELADGSTLAPDTSDRTG